MSDRVLQGQIDSAKHKLSKSGEDSGPKELEKLKSYLELLEAELLRRGEK